MSERNPDHTRRQLLEAAFDEIYERGYHATNLDAILGRTGVTKGALYHHFGSKQALGYAVVEEIIANYLRANWVQPLANTKDPVPLLLDMLEGFTNMSDRAVRCGCPINNLTQEMSTADEGFRVRLEALLNEWIGGIGDALERGQRAGKVRRDVDARAAATLLVAMVEGLSGLTKNAGSVEVTREAAPAVKAYLEFLRGKKRKT